MTDTDQDQHLSAMNQFIELANTLQKSGIPTHVVSWAMMTGSAVYATYSVAGNAGGLNPSGVDKVVNAYRDCLMQVQDARKAEVKSQGGEIRNEESL